MALKFFNANASGYNAAGGGAEPFNFDTVFAATASGTNPRRAGGRAYKLEPAVNNLAWLGYTQSSGDGVWNRHLFGFNIERGPESGDYIELSRIEISGGSTITLRLSDTLVPSFWIDSTQLDDGSAPALELDEWYQAELDLNTNTGVGSNKEWTHARIMRDADHAVMFEVDDLVNHTTGSPSGYAYIGRINIVTGESTPPIIWATDVIWMDNQGSYNTTRPTGLTFVNYAKPTADVTRMVWQGGAGGTTNLWDGVDNVPPAGLNTETNASQIEHLGGGTSADDYDADCQTFKVAGGMGPRDTVLGAVAFTRHAEDASSGTKTGHVEGVQNPAITAATFNFGDDGGGNGDEPTGWRTKATAIYETPTISATATPRARIRRTSTGGPDVNCDQLGFMFVWEKFPNLGPPLLKHRNVQRPVQPTRAVY